MKNKLLIILTFILALSFVIPVNTIKAAPDVNVTISGPSQVEVGETYEYDITVTATASSIMGTIECSSGSIGGTSGTWSKDSSSGYDESITATGSIKVTVSENASAGQSASIVVSGSGTSVNSENFEISEFSISGSKTISVIASATSAPTAKPTAKPTATATKKPATAKPTATDSPEPTDSPTPSPSADTPSPSPSITIEPTATPTTNEVSEIWFQLIDQVNIANDTDFTVSVNEDCVIPYQLLSVLKEKGANLVITTPSYKCTIKGSEIEDISDISKTANLDMVFYKDAQISSLANNQDNYQLHFNNESLPTEIYYTFSVIDQSAGQIMYLYYYNPDTNTLEFISSSTVGDDNTINIGIPHYSSYILSSSVITNAINNPLNTTEAGNTTDSKKMNFILLVVFVVLIFVLYIVLMVKLLNNRRKKANRYLPQ